MSAWDLSALEPVQRGIVEKALARTDFDWDLLLPRLSTEKGRPAIPVEFADLSRSVRAAVAVVSPGAHDHDVGQESYSHEHEDPELPEGLGHIHMVDPETGDKAHGISYRRRTLGLAWYSGRVSIDSSLTSDPELAQEVFLCEAAHMVDFFWMTDAQRRSILEAYGAVHWFEESGEQDYEDWTGESFMVGFSHAFSDLRVRFDQFTHKTTPAVAAAIRGILREGVRQPAPITPETQPAAAYGRNRSKVYHMRDHILGSRERAQRFWHTAAAAEADGRRLCRTCERKISAGA